MKALVYHGPGQRAWETMPDPRIEAATDAIVRIDTSTICGTDLHILKGDVPEVEPGRILGHEAVGTVVEVGDAVSTLAPGDRVLVSCITSCGRCRFCKEARYGLCTGGGGWIFGHLIDGLQAELARVPFADTSVHKIPEGLTDEEVIFLADILPTSYEVGVLAGRVEPGDTVAIVGAGPIGLAAVMTAKLFTPGRIVVLDIADARLEKARAFGADVTINNGASRPGRSGHGADGRARCRRGDRGSRRPGDVRALRRAHPARRPGRERRRPRPRCNTSPRAALDPGRHNHDRAGGHVHDTEADEADRRGTARSDAVRDPSLRARRDDGGVRDLRRRGDDECAEGRPLRTPGASRGRQGGACRDRLALPVQQRRARPRTRSTCFFVTEPLCVCGHPFGPTAQPSPACSRASRSRASTVASTVCRLSGPSSWSRSWIRTGSSAAR